MSHAAQRAFFARLRTQFPDAFTNKRVLDCGSLNVNGSLRELFTGGIYLGIDIRSGPDVDLVTRVHEYTTPDLFDTVVSAEMLEHDEFWSASIERMYALLKPAGLLAISCAGPERPEHGTAKAPDSLKGPQGDGLWGTSPEYYRPLSLWDIQIALGSLRHAFTSYGMEYLGPPVCDTYFWGVKRAH